MKCCSRSWHRRSESRFPSARPARPARLHPIPGFPRNLNFPHKQQALPSDRQEPVFWGVIALHSVGLSFPFTSLAWNARSVHLILAISTPLSLSSVCHSRSSSNKALPPLNHFQSSGKNVPRPITRPMRHGPPSVPRDSAHRTAIVRNEHHGSRSCLRCRYPQSFFSVYLYCFIVSPLCD